jgi:catechol 2,3-dioxygenase-like lactoylglutathione lyase family enzyme
VHIRIDHVVIHVSDWERSNAFYHDVLGAELIDKGDGSPGRHYRFGDQQFNVHGPGMSPYPVADRPAEPGGADLCCVWDGPIEEAVQHLRRHEVEIVEGPAPRYGGRGGGTSVYFRDPDGSLLEFISYEKTPQSGNKRYAVRRPIAAAVPFGAAPAHIPGASGRGP